MLSSRYEEYEKMRNGLPFILHSDIKRNRYNFSKQTNWHENLELQFCISGCGTVLLDGKKLSFCQNDIAVANSNVIHYTGTDSEIIYDALIIGTDFCNQMNFDLEMLQFESKLKNPVIFETYRKLKKLYSDLSDPCRIAQLNILLLEILIELVKNHSLPKTKVSDKNKNYEIIKLAIIYIRDNYQQKITLDEIAKAVSLNKYTLCKDFKKYTDQTVFENLNHYRCVKAIDCLTLGSTVADAASLCGFDNFSYFAKTFKKHFGMSPKEYKNLCK